MPEKPPQPDDNNSAPSDDDVESAARESGISKEQVAQLRRATETEAELSDAAGAAARWS